MLPDLPSVASRMELFQAKQTVRASGQPLLPPVPMIKLSSNCHLAAQGFSKT